MSGRSSSLQSPLSSTGMSETLARSWWVDSDGTAHELCRLLVFVGTEFLGESPIDPGTAPELGWRRSSVAYFCHHCGEIWGRLVLVGSTGREAPFEVVQVACEQHPDQWEVAGSLLGGYRGEGYLEYLPAAALQREFLIHLKHLDKEKS